LDSYLTAILNLASKVMEKIEEELDLLYLKLKKAVKDIKEAVKVLNGIEEEIDRAEQIKMDLLKAKYSDST